MLDSAGGALEVESGGSIRDLQTMGVDPAWSDVEGALGAPGTSLWLAFAAHARQGISPGQFAGLQLFEGNVEHRFIGAPFFDTGRPPNWGLDRPGLEVPVYSESVVSEQSLLVARIDFPQLAGQDAVVSLWIDPPLDLDAPGDAPDAVVSGPDFRFNRLQLNGNFEGFVLDELRLGTTYADVVPARPIEELFVEESFETPGAIAGQTGGVGFAGPWAGGGTVDPDGLSYESGEDGLLVAGGALDPTTGSSRRDLALDSIHPDLADTVGKLGAPGAEVWLSFLAEAPNGIDLGQFAGLQLFDGGTELRFIGAPFFDAGRPPNWGLDRPGLNTPLYSGVPVSEPAWMVLRMRFAESPNEDSSLDLWVSPSLDATPPDDGALTLTGPDLRLDRLQIVGNVPGFRIDELRVGPSFAAIAPVAP